MKKLFLARPNYCGYEPEVDYAAHHAVGPDSAIVVHSAGFQQSMTSKNCNEHLKTCLNSGGYDYFAMLHADLAPDEGWADILVDRLERYELDIIHAPASFKNKKGITSTAIGYCDNIWAPCRRITTTELHELPDTFDIPILREVYDPDAERMLFNTGCMVIRMGNWIRDFTGFTMADRLFEHDGKWYACSCSEDYMFAHWCHRHGLKAGATKVFTDHWGRWAFTTREPWGQVRDEEYFGVVAAIKEAATA